MSLKRFIIFIPLLLLGGFLYFHLPDIALAQDDSITLTNPLGEDANDPRVLIARLIQAIIGLSGAVALVMFIYSGLLFLTAGGNTGMIQKAKLLMLYTILGIIVIAGAFIATNTIFTAVLTGSPVVGQGDPGAAPGN